MKLYDDKLIILTGGAGFIGSCILKYLNDQNLSNVVIVDDLTGDLKWKNLLGKQFIEYVHKDELFQWLRVPGRASEIEAIIHMGACSDTTEMDVNYLMENNYRFTFKLAEYALKNEHRFIYASSAATYGDGSQGFSDNHDLLDSLRPLNPYGFSKHLFDMWAKKQNVLDLIVGLKFFNVFGPNEQHKGRMASVVYNLLPKIQEEKVIKLFKSNDPDHFKDGEQKRDFIYVKDVAAIVYQFLKNDVGGIYNIGSGVASTWNSLADAMFKSINMPTHIEYIDMPKDLEGKYQNYTCAEISKLKKVLKNYSTSSLEDGVKDYIQNYLLTDKIY